MLELILVGGAAYAFFQLAKNNGLTPWIWAVLAFVGFFGGAFIAGIIIGILSPNMINDKVTITIWALGAGILGILLIYLILKLQIKKKQNEIEESDLLDSDL